MMNRLMMSRTGIWIVAATFGFVTIRGAAQGPFDASSKAGLDANPGLFQDAGLASTPSNPPVTPETLGDLLMVRAQYHQALEAYSQAPKTSAVIWNKMGVAYHHLFAMDQAKHDYEQALALKPNFFEALSNLGSVYFSLKDYKRAEKYYRKALKVRPQSAIVYHNLGMLYFVRGKTAKGSEFLSKAFDLDPGSMDNDRLLNIAQPMTSQERARASFSLAELFAEHGQNDRALEYLRKAIAEGFDRKHLSGDPAFSRLKDTREFAELITPERPH